MSGDVLTDMFPQLATTLLKILSWLLAAGLLTGLALWWWQRRSTPRDGPSADGASPDRASPDRAAHRPPDQAGTRTAPGEEPTARRFLRIGLGLLWLLDGLLQAQPAMPAGFVAHTLTPGISSSPGWLAGLVQPSAQAWAHHPVTADAVTVSIELGLGLLLLLGGHGLLARAALWASLVFSAVVWVGGEFFGGLLTTGASWLSGAPGAIGAYALAAALLLFGWQRWDNGEAGRLARGATGVWMLAAAVLQAVPWEGSWSGSGLSASFGLGAQNSQPALFLGPITLAGQLAQSHPVAVNSALVVILVTLGAGLLLSAVSTSPAPASSASAFVTAGIVLCLATWWLAQDFGVLGGLATNPSTALPLAVLLAAGWPGWPSYASGRAEATAREAPPERSLPVLASLAAVGVGAVLVVPLLLLGTLLGPPDASAVEADSSGGVSLIPHRPAPGFTLTDQGGRTVSMSRLRGTLTLVTFLDPVCSDDCPVIANQIAAADRALGPLASRVNIVAIDTNPVFHRVEDVATFTRSHGLGDLPNWHFLAGTPAGLGDLLSAYDIVVQVPAVGMVAHGEGIYFVSPDGKTAAYLGDGANPALSQGYSNLIEQEIRRQLS
jgi:cytochrome oxidase Cu insertion factor (SCO1/SenC/PrrC family)